MRPLPKQIHITKATGQLTQRGRPICPDCGQPIEMSHQRVRTAGWLVHLRCFEGRSPQEMGHQIPHHPPDEETREASLAGWAKRQGLGPLGADDRVDVHTMNEAFRGGWAAALSYFPTHREEWEADAAAT